MPDTARDQLERHLGLELLSASHTFGDRGVRLHPDEQADILALADQHAKERIERLREALRVALLHIADLRRAWARGVISEHDGKGGARSNRNVDVENVIRAALEEAGDGGD